MQNEIYIHFWKDNETGKVYMHEQSPVGSFKESLDEMLQEQQPWNTYSHTLHIVDGVAKIIDINQPWQEFENHMKGLKK